MWLARQHTGLTLREIGAWLGTGDYAAVSMAIKRLMPRLKTDKALLRQAREVAQLLNVEMSPQ
jgi:chromosomal replication initiation ATPase DnaA